jgi:hypothetical protein
MATITTMIHNSIRIVIATMVALIGILCLPGVCQSGLWLLPW